MLCENTAVFPRCSNSKTMLHATLLPSCGRSRKTPPSRMEAYEEGLRRRYASLHYPSGGGLRGFAGRRTRPLLVLWSSFSENLMQNTSITPYLFTLHYYLLPAFHARPLLVSRACLSEKLIPNVPILAKKEVPKNDTS